MDRCYYFVVKAPTGWEVKYNGQTKAFLYQTQAEAINGAAIAARQFWEKTGQKSGVRIQDANGLWRDERTYGNDPFPPRG